MVRLEARALADVHLDLKSLDILLQRVRRHPQDRALRLKAAEGVATLADYGPVGNLKAQDSLLAEAVRIAKLLRRALERANRTLIATDNDIAAVNAWVDTLHPLLLKAIERPGPG
jgi:hypothetical protein